MTTISLEMVLPALVGLWIDRQLGTIALFLVLGVVLGFVTGLWSLIQLSDASKSEDETNSDKEP